MQHADPTVRQLFRLFRRHNDVFVVGQHKDGLGRRGFHGVKDVVGAGIHGLTAADDLIHAQIGK